jgi:hypothetical protein
VKAAVRVDRGVLLGLGRANESPDLLGREDFDRRVRPEARLLDVGHRVVAELVDAPRSLQHAVEHREDLRFGPVAGRDRGLPGLDPFGGQVLYAQRAEGG